MLIDLSDRGRLGDFVCTVNVDPDPVHPVVIPNSGARRNNENLKTQNNITETRMHSSRMRTDRGHLVAGGVLT